jgi:hypothetical protein
MRRIAWLGWPAAAVMLVLWAQEPQERPEASPTRMPNGKLQIDEILKDDHEKSLRDVGQIIKLAEEIKTDLEKNDRHVLSIGAIRRTEEIEKLARRVRGRIRRY